MDNKNIMFRSSISGYNKSDVNDYLFKINNEFTQKQDDLNAKIKKIEDEADAAGKKCEELEAELEKLRGELCEKSRLLEEAESAKPDADVLHNLNGKLDEQDNIISNQYQIIDDLKNENEKLRTSLAEIKDNFDKELSELRQKANMYEQTSAKIGDTIISANRIAEETVASAVLEAQKIRDDAKADVEAQKQALTEETRVALEGIYVKLRKSAEESRSAITSVTAFAESTLNRAFAEIKKKTEDSISYANSKEQNIWGSVISDIEGIGAPQKTQKSAKKASSQGLQKKSAK